MTNAAPLDLPALTHPARARFAVVMLFMINGLLFSSWVIRIPDIKAQLQLTDAQLGLALFGSPAGVVFGQQLVGWMLPRWGSRRMVTAMTLIVCACYPLLALAWNLPTLLLATVLFGLFGGGMDVAMNTQAARVEEGYGRPLMSSFHGTWSVASAIAAAIGGLLVSRAVPVTPHFLGAVALSLVALVAARNGLINEQPKAIESPSIALPSRKLVPLAAVAFGVLVCEGAVGDWSGVYLREKLGTAPALAATAFVVFSAVVTAARLAGDWLTMRMGAANLLRGGGVLVVLGSLLILLTTTPHLAIAGYALIGAGIACAFPLVLSAAARTADGDPSRAIAAVATVGYTGSFVGPPLIGGLAELVTLRGALGLLGLIGVVILLLGKRVGSQSR